jgi:hypothetical protein
MSLYDKASLVLIPSGTKTGTVFSQKPTDGDGDFDFTRSSYATRVNSQGLIEKERSNLLLQSNNFDTTWGVNFGLNTPTSGQTGYDGTSDAWLLEKDAYAFTYMFQDLSRSGLQTYSAYAKANTLSAATIYVNGNASNKYAKFNLSDGSVLTTANIITSNTVDVGSGWYRLSITFDDTISRVRIYPDFSETSAGSIFIQDAQVEQGLVATDVIETTTAAVYEGITDNVPRLDYDGDCPSLLLEPQRINIVSNSEDFNSIFSTNRSTLTVNQGISPEGVNNAMKLTEDTTSSNTHFIGDGYNYTSGVAYSWSVFVKADGRNKLKIQQGNNAVISFNADFDLANETVVNYGNGTATIKDFGNGWYRCSIENTIALSTASTNINIFLMDGNSLSYSGDGTSGVLLYGLQLEQGSYATSYIPTYGTSVTRSGDVCNNAGDSTIFNDEEGVLFVEMAALSDDGTSRRVSLSNSSTSNTVEILFQNSGAVSFQVKSGNSFQGGGTFNLTQTEFNKIAVKYKENDLALWVNGSERSTDNSANTPIGLSELAFDDGGGGSDFYGKCKAIAYFNRALTDTELADLTT